MDLQPGDVVILKSGGHPVTVAEVHEDAVACVWMGEDGDLFRETLPVAVLEMAASPPKTTTTKMRRMKTRTRRTTTRSRSPETSDRGRRVTKIKTSRAIS